MVYVTSKEKLADFSIVEPDMENPGMVKKQNRKEIIGVIRGGKSLNIKDFDNRVIGFVQPDNVNGTTTGYNKFYLYNINMEEDWRRYDRWA